MLKLFKFLKSYMNIIPFIIIFIAIQSVLTLMLPDYMSRIISDGIKSPAYETTNEDGSGENIAAVISPYLPFGSDSQFLNMLTVKKYQRSPESNLVLDNSILDANGNGYAQLADENGNPFAYTDNYKTAIKGKVCYEKDAQGNYILDSLTRQKIVKYARDNNNSYIVTDENGEALATSSVETNSDAPVLAPYVTSILIYSFDSEPAALKIDEYGNAAFMGIYANEQGVPYNLKMGNISIPALKFERVGTDESRFGSLLLNESGNAQLKQVSYISVIARYGFIMVGITLLITIFGILSGYLSSKTAMGFGKDVRSRLYKKINSFSVFEMGKFGTASLITRTTNDITQIQTLTFMVFRMVVMTPIMFIGGLIMALNKNAEMTLVLVVSIPLIIILLAVVGKKVIPIFRSMQKSIDNLTLVARENLTGVRVIRAFNREQTEDKRFEKTNKDVTDIAIKANRIMSVMMPIVTLLMSLTGIAVIFIAVLIAKSDIAGTTFTQFGNMMAVIQYIMQIMMSLLMVMMLFVLFPRASASAARINEVLETNVDIHDPVNPVNPPADVKGLVKFDNVSFKFKGSDTYILQNINFTAKPGEVTAIIGSTGSGKTTLVNLIPRLFDVSEGSITVDGVDVKDYRQNDLREKIGFVPQKSLLFAGTIADNICFGKRDADKETIEKALEISQSKEFVDTLPKGLNAEVDQGGVNFSGGQKQRLSIARALVKNAEIYIFDDSFSALDFKTDSMLRKSLKENIKDSTVIIVAQRIGTVMNADNIIVLDEGKIVGTGTHKELFNSCQIYREIALSQLSEEELL